MFCEAVDALIMKNGVDMKTVYDAMLSQGSDVVVRSTRGGCHVVFVVDEGML